MTSYILLLLANCLIFGLLGLGLSIQWQLGGLLNFGIVGFFAIGAYVASMLAINNIPPYITVPIAAIITCIVSYPIGLTTVKLKADYLAIGMLGFGEIIRIGANSTPFVGGASGIVGIPAMFNGLNRGMSNWLFLAVMILVVLAVLFILNRIRNSPFGSAMIATKDDSLGASAIGKDVRSFRVKALMIGCLICGVAGGLYAYYLSYISPANFEPLVTFYVWAGIIIGGRSPLRALLGVLLFIFLLEGTRLLNEILGLVPADTLADARLMVTGLVMIVVLRFCPDGVFTLSPNFTRKKKRQVVYS